MSTSQTNHEMFNIARTVKKGDIVEKTDRTYHRPNCAERLSEPILVTQSLRVTHVEVAEDTVSITYIPCDREDSVQCGFGHFAVVPTGPKPFGPQQLKIVGHQAFVPRIFWTPLPGDRGYDLMC